jgi:hypothetical protein
MGHARRRRGSARGRRIEPEDFLLGDGVRPGWDCDRTVGSFAEAEREWQACRVEAWRLWSLRPVSFPPRGAVVHDGLQSIGDIEAFRARQPAAAAAIAEHLALWVNTVERARRSPAVGAVGLGPLHGLRGLDRRSTHHGGPSGLVDDEEGGEQNDDE